MPPRRAFVAEFASSTVSYVTRLCERPGCSVPAAVAYGMDSEQLLVWLEAVPDGAATLRTGVVCRRHADAMVVPRGWTLDDRRESRPRLFRVASDDATSELRRIKRPPRVRHDSQTAEPQLSFTRNVDVQPQVEVPAMASPTGETSQAQSVIDDVVVGDFVPSAHADHDETQAMPWRPIFDDNDDLSGLLHVDSPLLSRAFRGVARDQNSNT